jgi:hypothetical protein
MSNIYSPNTSDNSKIMAHVAAPHSIFDDTTTFIVNTLDNTKRINFSVANATNGTTGILNFTQTVDCTYTIPPSSVNTDIVITEGTQTINGMKSFTSAIVTDNINELTTGVGVIIDNIRIRSVNGTTTTAAFEAVGAAADISAVILPKGMGAILANIPDGTVAGGNMRGTYAIDLQRNRNTNTQVASGIYSVIINGSNNTALSDYGFIGNGTNNTAWAYSFIGNGQNNVAYGGSTVTSGNDNTTEAALCVISGGNNNHILNVGSQNAIIVGGVNNTVTGIQSVIVGGDNHTIFG